MTTAPAEAGPRHVLRHDLALMAGGGSTDTNAVLLVGEPGGGRTTLLREVEKSVEVPVLWVPGHDHAATAPYASLLTMLRADLWGCAVSQALLPLVSRSTHATVPADPPQILEHLPHLEQQAAPTLMIVDDLQLFDRQSQAVVTAIARRVSTPSRGVILATSDPAQLAGSRGLTSLVLPPLTVAETRWLIEERHGRGIPYRVAELLHRRTGGNPAALVGALQLLTESQLAGLDVIDHPLPLSPSAAHALGRNLAQLDPGALMVLAACAVRPTLTLAETSAVLGSTAAPLSALVQDGWVRAVGLDITPVRPAESLAAWSGLNPHQRRRIHTRLGRVVDPASDVALFHRAAGGAGLRSPVTGSAAVRLFDSGQPDLAMACALQAERQPGSATLGLATHYLLDRYIDGVRRLVARHRADPGHSALSPDDATSLQAEIALLSHVDKEQLSAFRPTATAQPERSWFRAAYFVARAQLASGELAEAAQTLDLVAESLSCADPDLASLHAVVAAELLYARGDVNAAYLLPAAIRGWSNVYEGPFGLEVAVAAFRLMLLGQIRPARSLLMRHAPTAPFAPALARSAFLTARMGVEISAGQFGAAAETLVEYDRALPYIGGGGVHRLAQAVRVNAIFATSAQRLAIEARLHNDSVVTLPTRFRSTLSAALGLRDLIAGDYERAVHELDQALRHLSTLAHPPAEILADLLEAKLGSHAPVADRQAVFQGLRRVLPDHDGERFPGLIARCSALTAAPSELDAAFADALQAVPAEFEVDRARTLLAYGRALVHAMRRHEAARPLGEALTIFEGEGLAGWVHHVRRMFAQERLHPPAGDPLSELERHIVTLLMQRKTNREIAGELFMSKRSLESHLTRIFPKLGVKRKSEILRDR